MARESSPMLITMHRRATSLTVAEPLGMLEASRKKTRCFSYPLLWPDEAVLRTAFYAFAAYRFSWFDAHLWAYAEVHRCAEILSEDFEHGRHIGRVRIRNPFLAAAGGVHELPLLYGSD